MNYNTVNLGFLLLKIVAKFIKQITYFPHFYHLQASIINDVKNRSFRNRNTETPWTSYNLRTI